MLVLGDVLESRTGLKTRELRFGGRDLSRGERGLEKL